MKIFIVYAHAEPQSFNGALFRTAQETLLAAGHGVVTSDLYAQKFDPYGPVELVLFRSAVCHLADQSRHQTMPASRARLTRKSQG